MTSIFEKLQKISKMKKKLKEVLYYPKKNFARRKEALRKYQQKVIEHKKP